MKVTKQLKIFGKVQGVSYRESMRQEAQRCGVSGWVRNRKDGSVEALVQGEQSLVGSLLEWCRRGPPSARVDRVEEKTVDEENALRDFLRLETL
jgi:acylphosphatase